MTILVPFPNNPPFQTANHRYPRLILLLFRFNFFLFHFVVLKFRKAYIFNHPKEKTKKREKWKCSLQYLTQGEGPHWSFNHYNRQYWMRLLRYVVCSAVYRVVRLLCFDGEMIQFSSNGLCPLIIFLFRYSCLSSIFRRAVVVVLTSTLLHSLRHVNFVVMQDEDILLHTISHLSPHPVST